LPATGSSTIGSKVIEPEIVEREIEPFALSKQILNFRIGLRPGHTRIEISEDDLRHRKFQEPRDLAGDELRDQRFRSLSRAAKLENVGAVVIARDDRRKRPSFAKRHDVLGCRDRAEHWLRDHNVLKRINTVSHGDAEDGGLVFLRVLRVSV
jgi:hypothetical protein